MWKSLKAFENVTFAEIIAKKGVPWGRDPGRRGGGEGATTATPTTAKTPVVKITPLNYKSTPYILPNTIRTPRNALNSPRFALILIARRKSARGTWDQVFKYARGISMKNSIPADHLPLVFARPRSIFWGAGNRKVGPRGSPWGVPRSGQMPSKSLKSVKSL